MFMHELNDIVRTGDFIRLRNFFFLQNVSPLRMCTLSMLIAWSGYIFLVDITEYDVEWMILGPLNVCVYVV